MIAERGSPHGRRQRGSRPRA